MLKKIKPFTGDLNDEIEVIQDIEVFIGEYLRRDGDIGRLDAGHSDGDFDFPDLDLGQGFAAKKK